MGMHAENIGLGGLLEVLCFSHLRWNFVYQRPQHLMSRLAQRGRVHLWEEPVFQNSGKAALVVSIGDGGIRLLTPTLPLGLNDNEIVAEQKVLLDKYVAEQDLDNFIAWYYTPMALRFSYHLAPAVVVYDCMDELSAFQNAPPELIAQEQKLFAAADVVFAGGASLYASKKTQHDNVHLFPSSIDYAHFAIARLPQVDPPDQEQIPHPRIGFFGVLDERLDRDLLRDVATAHPEWSFVLIGPVVKISEEELPRGANLHYVSQKAYTVLPTYLANWDVAMLPFALNASTRFISPTKTPEYLAAGKPVVSTPIRDVVEPYGTLELVHIAADAEEFGAAIQECLKDSGDDWLAHVDRFLSGNSWDATFEGMLKEIEACVPGNSNTSRSGRHKR